MAWLEDATEEFKKLPTGGKIAVGAGFLLVAGLGFMEYRKGQSAQTSGVSGVASPSTDTSGMASGANSSSPFPTVPGGNTGNVPVLPSNYQALLDQAGNLLAFQPTPTATTPTPTPTPSGSPNALLSQWPSSAKIALGQHVTANGQLFTIVPGSQGRIWGVPGAVSNTTALNAPIGPGQKQLLFQPPMGDGGDMGGGGNWRMAPSYGIRGGFGGGGATENQTGDRPLPVNNEHQYHAHTMQGINRDVNEANLDYKRPTRSMQGRYEITPDGHMHFKR